MEVRKLSEQQKDVGKLSKQLNKAEVLVIATLIATVTFQAGINPPGGVWQEQSDEHEAGKSIYASKRNAFYVFLVFNTFAFSTSILVIFLMTRKFPYCLQIFMANIAVMITYGSAIFAVTPHESVDLLSLFHFHHSEKFHFRYIFLAGLAPFLISGFIHFFVWARKRTAVRKRATVTSVPE